MATALTPTPAELLELVDAHAGDAPVRRSLALLRALEGTPAERLTIGARDRALVGLRRQLFGDLIESLTRCPSCGDEIELGVRCSELAGGDEPAALDRAELVFDGYSVGLRLPTCGDLAACLGSPGGAADDLLRSCIVEASRDGSPLAPHDLPAHVRSAAADRLAELDDGALIELAVECPGCQAAFLAPFDITAHLWEELAAWSAGLLDDVHTLAWAYGWSEREILALAPGRRQRYLERVLG